MTRTAHSLNKGTGEYREDVVVAGELDVMFVKKQIVEVYGKIQNKEFSEGCGNRMRRNL